MNILLLGSGGREHALAWKISQSELLTNLFIAPGNAGTHTCGTNLPLQLNDFEQIKNVVLERQINLVIVGPEAPLVDGIVDYFLQDDLLKDIHIIGPGTAGAELEGSKHFAKEFMKKYEIPTAKYKTFSEQNLNEIDGFFDQLNAPYVLKADGLAAGKGVLIIENIDEAKQTLKQMITNRQFGDASKNVVVEEFLAGIELSVFVLTDGNSYKILPEAKDYKRIGEGDTGPNTGGMGAVSPVPFAQESFLKKVEENIIKPTINGLKKEGIDYKGFLFIGLMKVKDEPFVIEYNVRMGDPETEVVIPRIKTDLISLMKAVGEKTLKDQTIEIDHRTAATVMLVSGGYPGSYAKGYEITGIDKVLGSIVFHAGTTGEKGDIKTSGGRVMALTSFGESLNEALETSFQNAERINFEAKTYRKDIGFDLQTG